MLPETVKTPLRQHLQRVRAVHERDLADGYGRVHMLHGLARKYATAAAEWRWQWVFPQANRCEDQETGEQGRHHLDESLLRRAVREAVQATRMVKRASCHTFRHAST